jgi:hypothetical protein
MNIKEITDANSKAIKDSTLYNLLSNFGSCENLIDWPQNNYYSDLPITKNDIPELIDLASNLELFLSSLEEELWIPVHAWRILGNFTATEASKSLVNCLSEYCICDFACDELPLVFAMIGSAAIGDLRDYLYNSDNSEDSKILAVEAIGKIALKHDSCREDCVEILANFLDQSNEQFKRLNGVIIWVLQDLQAVFKINSIRNAFERDIVDLVIVGDIEDVEIALNLRTERETVRAPIFPFMELLDFLEELEEIESEFERKPIKSTKIGRNEVCFCGSGKKYKKCCIDG